MEIAENLVRLYQRLAAVCQDGEGGEDLLAEAEDNALAACTAESREAYDSFLVAAALALQQPERAVAALENSERMQPDKVQPSLHLAKVYTATGRYEEALQACDRAFAKAGGAERQAVRSVREQVLQCRNGEAT